MMDRVTPPCICKQLASADDCIRVIENSHNGVAQTRNAALAVATGEYVCFVDADDTIDSDYLEVSYAHRDFDMVVCGYWVDSYTYEGNFRKREKHVQPEQSSDFKRKEALRALFLSGAVQLHIKK